ncbi:hypothetical protein FNF27_05495 [Cafeteria roenbergensis]|uniref:Amino acid transporter transmembrane domain-containing protein n=3 Tax=Cafeteria roenbergensis TaxID=33653 RepID=A0A5A8DLU9_CAFRO|nr:hypothetical protein FNF31_01444 [Cafeteria roenbergensis]KAA0169575.1 hypothetical protein FNF28_02019 [Cafeteria roenbergensis]KAA0173004.1 hypothetical protein FNF27_05495 [Cafeteria roenbergensis]
MPSQREARSTSEATALLDAADGAAHDAGKRDLYAEDRPGAHNSMSFWVAACFCINYVMGSGFLGLPAVFHDAGLLLSPVTLLFFMWLSDGTKDLLVEAMARREALARLDERHAAKLQASAEVRRLTRAGQHVPPDVAALASNPVRWRRRDFVVSHVRTFQVNELMLGLWGRTAEILYMVGVALYLTGAMWGYSSVFSTSFAANIPLPFLDEAGRTSHVCDAEKDWANCASHYHICLLLFALMAIPLACMEFREQAAVQVTMTAARIVVLFLLVGTALGALGCDGVAFTEAPTDPEERTAETKLASGLGFLRLLPVCLFAFIFHHSAPGVAEPVRDKAALPGVFSTGFVVTGLGYLVLATTTAYYFAGSVKQQASLSWEGYVGCMPYGIAEATAISERSWLSGFVSIFVLIFPALDVLSAFPLNAVTLANSLATAFLPEEELHEMHSAIEDAATASAAAKAANAGRSWVGCLVDTVTCAGPRAAATNIRARVAGDASAGPAHTKRSSSGVAAAYSMLSDTPAEGAADSAPAATVAAAAGAGSALAPEEAAARPMVCFNLMRRGTAVKLAFRIVASSIPVIGAAFVTDLGTILAWTGVVGVFIGLTVPALLQIRSKQRCEEGCVRLWREREGAHRPGSGASPMPEMASPALGGALEGVAGAKSADATGLEMESSRPGRGAINPTDRVPAAAAGSRSSGAGAGAAEDGEDDDSVDVHLPGEASTAVAMAEVEEDDVVALLLAQRASATISAADVGAAAPGVGDPDPEAVRAVLKTPFDHSVLSRPGAPWIVVAFSAAMVIVVVVGLIAFGQTASG